MTPQDRNPDREIARIAGKDHGSSTPKNDALVRITSTSICGSGLHMYEGRASFAAGFTACSRSPPSSARP